MRIELFTNDANVTNLIVKKIQEGGLDPLGCFLLTTGFVLARVLALEINSGYPRPGASPCSQVYVQT